MENMWFLVEVLVRAVMVAMFVIGMWNGINLVARVFCNEMIDPYPMRYWLSIVLGLFCGAGLVLGWPV